jgi:hypothetical protein
VPFGVVFKEEAKKIAKLFDIEPLHLKNFSIIFEYKENAKCNTIKTQPIEKSIRLKTVGLCKDKQK